MRPTETTTLVLVAVLAVSAVGVAGVAAAQGATEVTTVNGTVRVHAAEDATIEGTTDLDPGTNVTVRLRSTGETQPSFIATEEATVREDGTFAIGHDFSQHAPGDTFSVTVLYDDATVAEVEGRVVAADAAVTPTETTSPTPYIHTTTIDRRTDTLVPGFGAATAVAAACVALVAVVRRID
ncbi:BGTF surface domain-containing protein [Halobaculum litoreum]|uniref:BGTF surface domain-containing protein n=1 Tax=Halobaculum litoreum TaxID=3031998 RepID=A0ABD5XQE1_9EURY|nr:BGTF surface domain-containing protein [Halobaculum sp. DT92]